MYIVLIVLTLICALLLICVVLVQKSKGGGLSSSFAGSNQIMGVRRTNSFIEKLTWGLAGAICLLSILATFAMPKAINASSSRVSAAPAEQAVPADFNTEVPAAPVAAPAPAADQTPAQAPAAEETPAE
ncbi:preprotein translocase subunit SecG [Duncaniella sp.]|uniref:preprotein translocase subunit SecG n=1 Tax=Duncaniella sp. TaxID=2518496 RepID=UPI0023C8FF10|nr:preprotein translocase subunit SecG [Duncaniella sp.]MDE5689826.1 preprotein translocase subunit SecG [Duncaniella sp.]MDE5905789.1 preprotein translocase subunit SecG [Duncaniella sp.]MDE7147775.1 preprotein translocase subunit SecG [Duncaniella sp.]